MFVAIPDTKKRLHVLMLGWEFPPAMAGGLGVATKGIADALRSHADVTLLLPESALNTSIAGLSEEDLAGYQTHDLPQRWMPEKHISEQVAIAAAQLQAKAPPAGKRLYGHSLMDEVAHFTEKALKQAEQVEFDIIHAHDWMTFPAALAIKAHSDKPLVLHIHSLETDRTADPEVKNPVYEVERTAIEQADAVLAVSDYTQKVLIKQYGADQKRTFTVHNGTEALPGIPPSKATAMAPSNEPQQPYWMGDYKPSKKKKKRRVLFLGRITAQKGPLTFVRTAKRLLQDNQQILFTVAGLGDQLEEMMQLAVDERIDRYIDFRGFVKRKKLHKLLKKTDVLFMPSVSEPFGLVALEAAQLGLPIVMSKQSGVAEVLPGVLMAAYWDSQLFARHLDMLLTYKALRKGLGKANKAAVKALTWQKAASSIAQHYERLAQKPVARPTNS